MNHVLETVKDKVVGKEHIIFTPRDVMILSVIELFNKTDYGV